MYMNMSILLYNVHEYEHPHVHEYEHPSVHENEHPHVHEYKYHHLHLQHEYPHVCE